MKPIMSAHDFSPCDVEIRVPGGMVRSGLTFAPMRSVAIGSAPKQAVVFIEHDGHVESHHFEDTVAAEIQ